MMTMRSVRRVMIAGLIATLGAGCQKHEFPPPDREQRVLDAEAVFAEISFDSIAWESDSARVIEGNIVYASTCRRCHGTLGEGGTDYARNRNLDVPSIVGPARPPYDDVPGIRHSIFVGHMAGMPTFGISTLTFREIDAAAWYIVHVLRPDVITPDTNGMSPLE